jgi:ERCC4-type nuclease
VGRVDELKAPKPPLVADVHEPADIVDAVRALGVPVEVRKLQPADYVVGPVAVERKTIGDFASSLFNKRLFDQVDRIRSAYGQALLVVEGSMEELEGFQNPAAFYGALCHIALDRGVSVIPTPGKDQTAKLLATMHKRLDREASVYGLRYKPPNLTPQQEMMFVVQGLPSVGGVLSSRLLERFGTVRRVMRAQERELRRIPLVGPEKARRISEVLDRPWEGRQARLEEGDDL